MVVLRRILLLKQQVSKSGPVALHTAFFSRSTTMAGPGKDEGGVTRVTQAVSLTKMEGEVAKGFGRGSTEIGCPTANFNEKVVEGLPADFQPGIYFGWATISSQPETVRKAVVSIGWNPYYNNTKKSVETHILHNYEDKFYGDWLKLLICGYIRPECNFDSLDSLIQAIKDDVQHANNALDQDLFKGYQNDSYFSKQS